jgi:hypothetical protein
LTGKKGERLCPICDSPLEPGSKKCGFCGTDLTIFDAESDTPKEEPKVETTEESTGSRLEEIFFGSEEEERAEAAADTTIEPEVEEIPEPAEQEAGPEPEEVRPETETTAEPSVEEPALESVEEPAEAAAPEAEQFFECPECGGKVGMSAKSCPSCGVVFADEGADMFQCPACNTLVDINATSCPGCGAIFVESEEEAAKEPESQTEGPPSPVQQPHLELEKPVSEVLIEPEIAPAEEEAEEEPERKGLFGGLFGKKKKKRQEADEEAADAKPEFPSILRRARVEEDLEAEIEVAPEEERPVEIEPEAEVEEEVAPERRPEPLTTPEPVVAPPTKPLPQVPRDKTKGKELARLTAEIQPLMRLAIEKGIDVSKSRKLVDEGAMSVRARQMDKALECVREARETVLESMTSSIEQMATDLRTEVKVARALGGEVSRANAYLDELEKARKTGDFEAVFVYADKMKNELLPITGRYNESKQKISSLRNLIADSEVINVNTKDARTMLTDAARAFESNDFDRVDLTVRSATDRLFKDVEPRMEEEIRRARDLLVELKGRGQNITPMITALKSARTLMKSKDYPQALREMREFKDQVRRAQ